MSITILIPTRKRPEFLSNVLESIRLQTAVSSIDKIIVSENSTDTRSKAICEQFADLNISYFQQESELTAIAHFCWLIEQSATEYTAMLHDDDWWYPTHLQSGLGHLKEKKNAAYFSNFVFAKNEIMKDAFFHYPTPIGHFSKKEVGFHCISLSFADVSSICYLYTPFHMSGMIAKTNALKYASDNGLKEAKMWYADRIIYPYLATHGDVIFNTQVLCAIRQHDESATHKTNFEIRYNEHAEGSVKIKALAASRKIDVLDIWEGIYSSVSKPDWQKIAQTFRDHFGSNNDNMFINLPAVKRPVTFKRLVKQVLPYGLVNKLSR